ADAIAHAHHDVLLQDHVVAEPQEIARLVQGHVFDSGMAHDRAILPGHNRGLMCRSIKILANFEPPATDEEIHASALQFVRKLTRTPHPPRPTTMLFPRGGKKPPPPAAKPTPTLNTPAPPPNREKKARKAKERARQRYYPVGSLPPPKGRGLGRGALNPAPP